MIVTNENFWIVLKGNSMSPLLINGDELLIESINLERIRVGDLVLFKDRNSSELTIHRLIARPFITKGDYGLLSENNPVDHYLGRAIAYKRKNKIKSLLYSQTIPLFFAKLRMGNYFIRKVGLLGLIFFKIYFVFYSAITKLDHTK